MIRAWHIRFHKLLVPAWNIKKKIMGNHGKTTDYVILNTNRGKGPSPSRIKPLAACIASAFSSHIYIYRDICTLILQITSTTFTSVLFSNPSQVRSLLLVLPFLPLVLFHPCQGSPWPLAWPSPCTSLQVDPHAPCQCHLAHPRVQRRSGR